MKSRPQVAIRLQYRSSEQNFLNRAHQALWWYIAWRHKDGVRELKHLVAGEFSVDKLRRVLVNLYHKTLLAALVNDNDFHLIWLGKFGGRTGTEVCRNANPERSIGV